jgi:hypothetical protein
MSKCVSKEISSSLDDKLDDIVYNVGSYQIRCSQFNAAKEAFDSLHMQHGCSAVVIAARTQQGKTGTSIGFIAMELNAFKDRIIIYLQNIPDNDAFDQNVTQALYDQADFDPYKVLAFKHGAGYKECRKLLKEYPHMKGKITSVLIDESHVGLEEDAELHLLLQELGINLGAPANTWSNQKIKLVQTSATPAAHIYQQKLAEEKDLSVYKVIVLEKSPSYIGFEDIKSRMRPSFPYVKVGKVTPEFSKAIADFDGYCKSKNKSKHLIVRLGKKKEEEIIEKWMRETHPSFFLRVFRSDNRSAFTEETSCHPIHKLDDILSNPPTDAPWVNPAWEMGNSVPNVIFIYDSLRMAKTITSVSHLGGWIDCIPTKKENQNTDTVVQSIGRLCGYTQCRKEADFPIYCNTEKIDEYTSAFESGEHLYGATWLNQQRETENSYEWSLVITADDKDEIDEYIRNFCEENEQTSEAISPTLEDNFAKRNNTASFEEASKLYDAVKPSVRNCRTNIQEDKAKELARAVSEMGFTQRDKGSPFVLRHMDAKSINTDFEDSWNDFEREHPDWVGKYILFGAQRKKAQEEKVSHSHRKNSMMPDLETIGAK